MQLADSNPFVVETWVARGGMGDVYRARHRATERLAAIKRLHPTAHASAPRFELEARALRELRHDAIVEYLGDGIDADGAPWIAMEWLEGEDLAHRIAKAPLTVDESITLVRRIAEALAHAHARGLIHRDLKPSNIFLCGGDVARAKILDFGLARYVDRTHALTSTHHVLGTVAYMAPEQARADRGIDARADLYSLGVVWFEALTGQLPFNGEHAFAVLAKLLLEDPPRVRAFRRDVSTVLDDLVAQLLSRDPGRRPSDGTALLRALGAVVASGVSAGIPTSSTSGRLTISHREARFGSVILVASPAPSAATETVDTAWTHTHRRTIDAIARRFDGDALALSADALIVTLGAAQAPGDSAARAAACAKAIAREFPDCGIALAAGTIERNAQTATGLVIDRAVAIVRDIARPGVWTDESTARLLAGRYAIEPVGVYYALHAADVSEADDRTLLGKRTPFVGRDRELSLLEGTLHECIDEDVARSVIVTAPPGTGKSRLRTEFLARVAIEGSVRVLTASGDPLSPGAALSLARQLVRADAQLRDGALASEQRTALHAYLGSLGIDAGDGSMFSAFCELASIANAEPASFDPELHRDKIGRAIATWLDAIIARGPTLIVLEDLHWGDAATVEHLVAALERHSKRAVMLAAFARPEVRAWIPGGRLSANTLDAPLGGLTRRAAERLVRSMLGDDLSTSRVARIVARADGNAFHLEELIRRTVEWGDDDLPDTVFALLQSRLDAIGPEPRRALRAASVFGERFWAGGVQQLLGYADEAPVRELLDQLAQQEVLELVRDSRFPTEREYGFRHSLLRDAAYATLTDADREAAHRLAGEWLLEAGEHQPRILAAHFERGRDPERALPWILAAADVAFTAYQLDEALDLARRGIEYGAKGTALGRLQTTIADVLTWKSDPDGAHAAALEGLRLSERAGPHWFLCASLLVLSAVNQGDADSGVMEVLQTVLTLEHPPDPTGRCAFSIAMLQYGMLLAGQRDLMVALLEPMRGAARSPMPAENEFTSWHLIAEGFASLYCTGRPGDALRSVRQGEALSLTSKAVAGVEGRAHLATVLLECGLFAESERIIRAWIASAEERGLQWMVGLASGPLARALTGQGRHAEALATAQHGVQDTVATNAHLARWGLAEALVATGRLDDAREVAEHVVAHSGIDGAIVPALRVLAEVALEQGNVQHALEQTDAALALLERAAAAPVARYGIAWTRLRSLRIVGRNEEADALRTASLASIEAEAATFEHEAERAAFLALAPIAALRTRA